MAIDTGPRADGDQPPRLPGRGALLARVGGAVALLVVGIWVYWAGHHPPQVPRVQLAGSTAEANRLVCGIATTTVSCPGLVKAYDAAFGADFVLSACYVTALLIATVVGAQCFERASSRRIARTATVAAGVVGLLEVVENSAVILGLEVWTGLDPLWVVAAAADVVKLTLLGPVALVAVVSVLVPCWRYATGRSTARRVGTEDLSEVSGPGPLGRLPSEVATGRPAGRTGIAVSGGGIRSASVTLGALQVLRAKGQLPNEGYLFSVSGGGYTAGALRLALQDGNPEALAAGRPVFDVASPEFDHLRAHGNYIADSAGQWLLAFGILLFNLLLSIFLIAASAVGAGLVLGLFYRWYSVSASGLESAFSEPTTLLGPPGPEFVGGTTPGAWWAIGTLTALAIVLWLIAGASEGRRGVPLSSWRVAMHGVGSTAAIVVVLTAVLPGVALLVGQLEGWVRAAGGIGSVLLAALTAAFTMAKKPPSLTAVSGRLGKIAGLTARLVVSAVIALVGVVVLGTTMLVARGFVALPAAGWGPWTTTEKWTVAGIVGGLAVAALIAVLLDQTSASLHPFYRQRLGSAFAVCRDVDGRPRPIPYAERTTLDEYATPKAGLPTLILAGAAQISTPGRTPAGLRAVSFTFASDWVGGPQVGYVKTSKLIEAVPCSYKGDLTLLGAMAISGAAFASAMGSSSTPYQVLLALSNARLGAWLPNPSRLGTVENGDWRRRRVPLLRRESYHLREIFGRYADDNPLLLVTDGGHYDNLGLVEALRHRCSTVVVIDASDDGSEYPTDLNRAIAIARGELGVEVELDDPGAVVAGSSTDPPPVEELEGRLARHETVTGRITYPGDAGGPATGRLVFAKARLTPNSPEAVLAYATDHKAFPADTTLDQWFSHEQFDAYLSLGRHLGEVAVDALNNPPLTSTDGAGPPSPTAPLSVTDWTLIMQGQSWGNGSSAAQAQR